MGSTYQFNVGFKGPTGLPKDTYVNTWHFYNGGAPTDFDNVRDMLKDFYCTTPTGNAVAKYMTNLIQSPATIKAYDMDSPKPRAPSYESTFNLTGLGTGTPVPFECAVCLSFEAARVSGQIQARRRNRVYLGPLASGILWSDGRPLPTAITSIMDAAKRLYAAQAASGSWKWQVYSGTDNKIYDIKHIWIDDSYDTQRRRGLSPSTRQDYRLT